MEYAAVPAADTVTIAMSDQSVTVGRFAFFDGSDDDGSWITVGGHHIFIEKGGSSGGGHGGTGGKASGGGKSGSGSSDEASSSDAKGATSSGKSSFHYDPSPGLSDEHRAIETKFGAQIAADPAKAAADYHAKFGNVLNTDSARELSPDYDASLESRSSLAPAVHEPSSSLVKMMYADDLAAPTPASKEKMVLFTGGGTGSGKSTALEDTNRPLLDKAKIVYDTTLNGTKSASSKIDQALAAGHKVAIAYVRRDPVESLVNGSLPRAERTGRTAPLDAHLATHVGSLQTVKELSQKYAGDDRVAIHVIDNTRGRGNSAEVPLSSLDTVTYNKEALGKALSSALEDAHNAGTISERVYHGTRATGHG